MNRIISISLMAILLCAACNSRNTTNGDAGMQQPAMEASAPAGKPTSAELAIEAYLRLKDALVESSVNSAKEAATQLKEYFQTEANINTKAIEIENSDDIEAQRAAFESISVELYQNLQNEGTPTVLYKQHCPMAFDNKGAFWLSSEEDVKNPYFGDKMLKCGRVEETITPND